VNVITLFPGQPSEEVERQIGIPIERALNGTPGVARLRNLSLFGLSFITLTFHDGVDALFARQQVLEHLRDAELPEGITPELGPLATPIGEIYRYHLRGGGEDPMKLRTLQDWVVRPAMRRVLGIANPRVGIVSNEPSVVAVQQDARGGKKVLAGMAPDRREDLVFLNELLETGKIKPVIDRRYPLEQTAEAHRYVDTGRKRGSVVITIAAQE